MDNNYKNGIIEPQELGSQSPGSNPGIVYNPANKPSNPGSLKIARQTVENLVFKTKDGGTIDIGTQDTSPATTAGAAAIVIYDGKNSDNEGLGNKVVFLSDGSPVILDIIADPLADTPIAPFSVQQSANPANHTEIADFSTEVIRNVHFSPLLFFAGPNSIGNFFTTFISDGTTPSGNLSGDQGDICYNGPGGQPFWCGGGTTWTAF